MYLQLASRRSAEEDEVGCCARPCSVPAYAITQQVGFSFLDALVLEVLLRVSPRGDHCVLWDGGKDVTTPSPLRS